MGTGWFTRSGILKEPEKEDFIAIAKSMITPWFDYNTQKTGIRRENGDDESLHALVPDTDKRMYSKMSDYALLHESVKCAGKLREFAASVSKDTAFLHNDPNLFISPIEKIVDANTDIELVTVATKLSIEHSGHMQELRTAYGRVYRLKVLGLRNELLSRLPNEARTNVPGMLYEQPTNFFGIMRIADDLEDLSRSLDHLRVQPALLFEKFNTAIRDQPNNWDVINRKGHLCLAVGRLKEAEACYRKVIKIGRELNDEKAEVAGLGNLGLVYQELGDLQKSEEMHSRAVKIALQIEWAEGMADQYGNLGLVYRKMARLDDAEGMHRRSLELNEYLGRLGGIANAAGNIGVLYQIRENYEEAEEQHLRALKINTELNRVDALAHNYFNLGTIYYKQGDFDRANRMYELGRDKMAGR